ncbi:hypothetical protein NEISUBOT_05674, partial [Neisseria subflava NJ9703]
MTLLLNLIFKIIILLQKLHILIIDKRRLKKTAMRGAWVAQSVEHLTLGSNSGHDLTVGEFEPHIRLPADS